VSNETADDLMTAELVRLHRGPVPEVDAARPQSTVAFAGPSNAVTEEDYQHVAEALGCSVAAVYAVAQVETGREPFLSDGTGRPSILFEAHIFNSYTNGKFLGAKDRHGVPLATAQWDETLYGPGGAHQYERLADACALDRNAALMATSWGMFQIMGFNWKDAGFRSCEEMVAAMYAGTAAHVVAFQNFIRSKQLADTLCSTPPDFETFAQKYNGPGNIAAYAAKMKSRYDTLLNCSPAPAPALAFAGRTLTTVSSNPVAGYHDPVALARVTKVTAGPAKSGHASSVTTTGSAKMPDINYGAALGDAASSAAAGMMFGPAGGIVGGLMGFAVDLVPQLFPHLFGKNSARVQAEVKSVLVDATGGKTNVSEVQAAVSNDPAKADEIRLRLAEIAAKADEAQRQADLQQRQADLEQMKLAVVDTANARGQMVDLAKAGSPVAWGAPAISALVLLIFAAAVVVAFSSPATANNALANAILGTLGTMSTAVVTYWVGSSAGSAQKTALLAKAPPIT
jgi:hypothetical protein